jgi:hypothetical protein
MFNIIPRFTDQDVETIDLNDETHDEPSINHPNYVSNDFTDVTNDISTDVTNDISTDVPNDDSQVDVSDNQTIIEDNDFNPENDDILKLRNAFNRIKNSPKLESDDEDEDNEDRIYILMVNNVPYYYDNNLSSARRTMMKLAKKLMLSQDPEDPDMYIMTNNDNELKIIIPYDFLFVKYSQTIHTLKIDYVIPYKQ